MRGPRFSLLPVVLALGFAPVPGRPAGAGERLKVWISLRDKGPSFPVPSGRAYEDAPVYAPCLDQLRGAGVEIAAVLKWQNRVSGWVDAAGTGTVAALACVRGVEEMPRKIPLAREETVSGLPKAGAAQADPAGFGAFDSLFIKTGAAALRDTLAARGPGAGAGLRVAVIDNGFRLGHQAFDSLFARNAIVDQWDFVAGDATAVSRTLGSSHGAMVLSQMAGDLPGVLQGLVPKARFLLYRTEEEANEAYAEEDYLAAGLERAVDSGAQVINISLGYRYDFDDTTEHDYPYAQMNGRTRPSTLAALGAARRGAIVVVAMGNEGLSRGGEPTLTAPADADSILSIGSLSAAGARCSYSGTGPSFDGRVKPEVSALGCSMPVANPSTLAGVFNQNGTSLSAPVVAGVAALLRQLHPASTGVDAQDIRLALTAAAARASNPDNLVGHGLIRAAEAHCRLAFDTACVNLIVSEPPSVAVKGVLVWRGGMVKTMPWPTPLDVGRARMWDLQGRSRRVIGDWDPEGDLRLRTARRTAPGTYILRVPALPDSTSP